MDAQGHLVKKETKNMSKAKKLEPTIEEVEDAIVRLSAWNPGIDIRSLREKAKTEGHKDEKCPKCGTTFLAHIHFINCVAADCPMKSEDGKSLLEMLKDSK